MLFRHSHLELERTHMAKDKADKAAKPDKAKEPAKADKAKEPAKGEKAAAVKSITKGAFIAAIAEKTELSKPQVTSVFEEMSAIIVKELSTKGPGVIAIPGLLKLKARRVKAVKGGKSVPNRFKPGETTVTKDKPAHTKVSARALKGLKESLK